MSTSKMSRYSGHTEERGTVRPGGGAVDLNVEVQRLDGKDWRSALWTVFLFQLSHAMS